MSDNGILDRGETRLLLQLFKMVNHRGLAMGATGEFFTSLGEHDVNTLIDKGLVEFQEDGEFSYYGLTTKGITLAKMLGASNGY